MSNTPISKQRTIKGTKLNCLVCKNHIFFGKEKL